MMLWRMLDVDALWTERLPCSRKGTRWNLVLIVPTAYRLIEPGSEWRLHREWYGRTALADLLGADVIRSPIRTCCTGAIVGCWGTSKRCLAI